MKSRDLYGSAVLPKRNTTDDAVRLGLEAWNELKRAPGLTLDRWMTVERALRIGRESVVGQTGAKPGGRRYNESYGHWLQANGFAEIDKAARNKLHKIKDR